MDSLGFIDILYLLANQFSTTDSCDASLNNSVSSKANKLAVLLISLLSYLISTVRMEDVCSLILTWLANEVLLTVFCSDKGNMSGHENLGRFFVGLLTSKVGICIGEQLLLVILQRKIEGLFDLNFWSSTILVLL